MARHSAPTPTTARNAVKLATLALAAMVLASAWVLLVVSLITLSLAVRGDSGATLRTGITRAMVEPMGDVIRRALGTSAN